MSNAVLVTGATGGIGLATTQLLVQRGYRVYAGVHTSAPSTAFDRSVETVQLDVTSPDSVQAAAKEVAARQAGAGLHAVVNNAGVIVQGPQELVPPSELRRQFEINVFGAAEVTRAFLPLLREGHGRVVNVSAPTARLPIPFAGPIGASKAALESLSHAARVELAPWRIPVIIVVPGGNDTAIFANAAATAQAALADADPERVALYARQLDAVAASMGRAKLSQPQSVAPTIVRAIRASRPRVRYIANTDARMFALLSHLPARLRDRLLTRALGLHKVV